MSTGGLKNQVSQKINEAFKEKIEKDGKDKSKVQHLKNGQPQWEPGKMKEYIYKAPRQVASTIFQARTRMLKVKTNYKNKYKNNLTCRACGLADETQNHAMEECLKLHQNDTTKVTPEMIFNQDTNQLNQTAHQIQINMSLLETYTKPDGSSGVPVQCGGSAHRPTHCDGVAQRPGIPAPNQ